MKIFLVLLVSMVASIKAFSENLTLQSGERQVQLIELYTSEGCSSCPPADRWLSALVDSDDLWKRFVPVAFHVDYWNYLGWSDRFSSSAFSDRQRRHQHLGNIKAVYTPGFVVAGKEWRRWFHDRKLPHQPDFTPGNLSLLVKGGKYKASFQAEFNHESLRLNIAVLGMDMITAVKQGENAGRNLKHDFIVLALTNNDSKAATWEGELPEITDGNHALAIAAWVSTTDTLAPLQAVGGFLQ